MKVEIKNESSITPSARELEIVKHWITIAKSRQYKLPKIIPISQNLLLDLIAINDHEVYLVKYNKNWL